jgi:hypothetical protein
MKELKQFFNQCMLFKSKERFDIILGAVTWLTLSVFFLILIVLAYLINLINQ